MDASKEYIKMCEKAKEIQGIKPNDSFSYHFNLELEEARFTCFHVPKNNIWLPCQDQLQNMLLYKEKDVFGHLFTIESLLFAFALHWMEGLDTYKFSDEAKQFGSMEQLWLAFVMEKIYSKQWNGEDWHANNQS